jgi:hypothetical protein
MLILTFAISRLDILIYKCNPGAHPRKPWLVWWVLVDRLPANRPRLGVLLDTLIRLLYIDQLLTDCMHHCYAKNRLYFSWPISATFVMCRAYYSGCSMRSQYMASVLSEYHRKYSTTA